MEHTLLIFIDLSHPLRSGQVGYPGDPEFSLDSHCLIAPDGFNLTRIRMGSHQGTHLDAPSHIFEDGKTLDRLPLEVFYGPAAIIDLAPHGCLEAGTIIQLDMLKDSEEVFTPGARVLLRTGWDRYFGSPDYFNQYPLLSVEAAHWIASRRIGLLGTDTPSVDGLDTLDCHQILLREGVEIVLVENLTHLENLPRQFIWIGFPLNIHGCDGSSIRAVALVE